LHTARITIFAGHYGSGKTTLALHYALALRQARQHVALCDMDIVNPYFRTADHRARLEAAGVELISSPYANTNVEMPWIPTQALRVLDDERLTSVIDLGGDSGGALAVGRFAERLQALPDTAFWLVVNPYRPLTGEVDALLAIRREIERAARLRFTGLVNNANLGAETTARHITESYSFLQGASEAMGLPIVMTAVRRELAPALSLPRGMGQLLELGELSSRFSL
jgi:energy-coupling factor transporter ATP-binding protein EcfA2